MEQRKIVSMGGKKSGKVGRRRGTICGALTWYLDAETHLSNRTEEHLPNKFPWLINGKYVAIAIAKTAIKPSDQDYHN